MANSYSINAATFRKFAANVNSAIWPDADIDSLSERIEAQGHQKLGKSAAYDAQTETQQYKAFQQILIDGVSGTILQSLDDPALQAAGKEKLIKYFSALKDLRKGKLPIIVAELNITDELNSNNYIPEASDTY